MSILRLCAQYLYGFNPWTRGTGGPAGTPQEMNVDIPSQSTSSVPCDPNLEDRPLENNSDHMTSHRESIALPSVAAYNRFDGPVSDVPRSQSGYDFETDDQSLPSPVFIDEPGREIKAIEGLSGEELPIDDHLVKEGWKYVWESPKVQKLTYWNPEHDWTLQPFIARYKSLRPRSTVPFRRDTDFVGGGDILAQLHEKCSQPAARTALVGLGGVGKSNYAIEYSYRAREQFPQTWVFWVHASNAARFEDGYRKIAMTVRLPGQDDPKNDIIQLVWSWLCTEENGRWIMILDNADDLTMFSKHHEGRSKSGPLSCFLPQTSNGSILVTSRSEDAAFRLTGSHRNIIKVEPMDEDFGLLLLKKKLPGGFDKGDATELLRALDYIPLAISQAATYISQRAPRTTVARYLDFFRKSDSNRANLLNRDAGDLRRDSTASNSIITTWQMSFEYIRGKRPSAARLLSLMSFFDRQGIPEFLLHGYDDQKDGSDINLEERADMNLENDIDMDFEDDVLTLTSYSLITTNAKGDQFKMPRLVQFSIRKWLELNGELEMWKERHLEILSRVFPRGEYENWKMCQVLFPHAEAVLAYQPAGKFLACRARVLDRAGAYAGSKGDYLTAERMIRRALEEYEKALGKEHPDALSSASNLATVLQDQGKYEAAEAMNRQALNGREKVLGKEHPSTLISISNLSSLLRHQGKYEAAKEMNRRALDGLERVLGKEHPSTLASVSNLASLLQDQGKYDEAEEMNRQALNGRKAVLGKEHPSTLTSVSNLASLLRDQGKYESAEEMNRQALDGMEKVLGKEHPDTRTSVSNLALLLQDQGKYEPAKRQRR